MSWSLTVAAIIERDGKFLVVEEKDKTHHTPVINQPAGHVEPGESAFDAVIRETYEEAGVHFTPAYIVGFYPLMAKNGRDYFRVCFAGTATGLDAAQPHDGDISAVHWLSREEIAAFGPRSALVLKCIDDFLTGAKAPLDHIKVIQNDRP